MHTIDTMEQGNFSSFIDHESTIRKLDPAVKERVILLLFGEVTTAEKRALFDFIDKKYEKCHSLALYITEEERAKTKKKQMSDFHYICNEMGIDPGKKSVHVNEHGNVFFTDDYHNRPVLLVEKKSK